MKLAALLTTVCLFSACNLWEPVLQPGFCNTANDCPTGSMCVADRCLFPEADAGLDAGPDATLFVDGDGMGGTGGGDAGEPGCSTEAPCSEGAPICDLATGLCGGCADDGACAALDGAQPFCDTSSGRCVACLSHDACPSSAPACVAGACAACDAPGAATDACKVRSAGTPACAGGLCVECAGSADCLLSAKPICAANACRACEGDPECVAKLGADPGVCMRHEDGRCATAADTVFVENLPSKCAAGPGAGSAAMPLCGLQQGVDAAKAQGKPLVVLKGPGAVDRATWSGPGKVSVVGKAGALVRGGAGPGFQATGGEVYLRDLKLEAGDPGLKVTTGGTLRVDNARVVNNPGGGVLVEGGKLVLERTLVSGNGPGLFTGFPWGGIAIQSPAPGTRLERVSVTDNRASGVSCSSAVQAAGVRATGNGDGTTDVGSTCGFTSCGAPSATCGAP